MAGCVRDEAVRRVPRRMAPLADLDVFPVNVLK